MAKLTGQAALDYILNANPNQTFRITSGGGYTNEQLNQLKGAKYVNPNANTYANSDKGFLGNLVWGITSPIRYGAEGLASWAKLAGLPVGGGKRSGQSYTGLLSDEELGNAVTNPIGTTLGETLKASSFMVPVGAGAKAAIGASALSGGMYGAGTGLSAPSVDLGNVIGQATMGAGMGGLLGGGLYGAGKAIGGTAKYLNKKVFNKLKDIDIENLGVKMAKKPTGYTEAVNLKNKVAELLKTSNLPLDEKGIASAYAQNLQNLQRGATATSRAINKNQILDDFVNGVRLEADITKGVAKANAENIFSKLAQKNTTNELLGLKFELQNKLGTAYKKLNNGLPLTPAETVNMAAHNAIDSQLKTIPEIAQSLQNMSILHQVAPDTINAVQKGVNIGVPMSGLKMNVRPIVAGTRSFVAKAAQKIPNIQSKLANISKMPATKMAYNILPRLGTISQMTQTAIPTQDISKMTNEEIYNAMFSPVQQPVNAQPMTVDEAIALASQAYGGRGKPADVRALAQMYLDQSAAATKSKQPAKQTEFQYKLTSAAKSAVDALKLLESGAVGTGKLEGYITQPFAEFIGQQTPENIQYRSSIGLARTLVRNALLGANMSEKELESITKFIPEYTDEPNIAKGKLVNFIRQLELISNNNVVPDELNNLTGY